MFVCHFTLSSFVLQLVCLPAWMAVQHLSPSIVRQEAGEVVISQHTCTQTHAACRTGEVAFLHHLRGERTKRVCVAGMEGYVKTEQKIAVSPPPHLTFLILRLLPYSVLLSFLPAFFLIFSYPLSRVSVTFPSDSN